MGGWAGFCQNKKTISNFLIITSIFIQRERDLVVCHNVLIYSSFVNKKIRVVRFLCFVWIKKNKIFASFPFVHFLLFLRHSTRMLLTTNEEEVVLKERYKMASVA